MLVNYITSCTCALMSSAPFRRAQPNMCFHRCVLSKRLCRIQYKEIELSWVLSLSQIGNISDGPSTRSTAEPSCPSGTYRYFRVSQVVSIESGCDVGISSRPVHHHPAPVMGCRHVRHACSKHRQLGTREGNTHITAMILRSQQG